MKVTDEAGAGLQFAGQGDTPLTGMATECLLIKRGNLLFIDLWKGDKLWSFLIHGHIYECVSL